MARRVFDNTGWWRLESYAIGRQRLSEPERHKRRYRDLVISARRLTAMTIAIAVDASPVGRSAKLSVVDFSVTEAAGLRASFTSSIASGQFQGSRALITLEQASEIGARLASVLFSPEVLELFASSLAFVAEDEAAGLRIRLAMDPELMDLPWEYLSRPDRLVRTGLSSFLLLDPAISLVRHAAEAGVEFSAIDGLQRLAFVGAFWEGQLDEWQVRQEFALLDAALAPVASFIQSDFVGANEDSAFPIASDARAAIFHYAGHCDFDPRGRAFLVKEQPRTRDISERDVTYLDDLGPSLAKAGTRLAVMSACNSGYWAAAKPLLQAGVPVVLGINGGVWSTSTIEFCTKLYESLAVGLGLDEAVLCARLHLMAWGEKHGLFDWGLFMVHMTCAEAVLFPRPETAAVLHQQQSIRRAQAEVTERALAHARQIDGLNFGEIMSLLTKSRVLILGRFTGARLAVLDAIKNHLQEHANGYKPELFTFARPDSRDLMEAIVGFAAFSRFVIADLSDPKSVPSELEAIAFRFQSVPIVPVIVQSDEEYATFESIRRFNNVIKPTVRYRDAADLIAKLDAEILALAEAKRSEIRPPTPAPR